MPTMESLCLSLDTAKREIQCLEAKNRRLREAHLEQVGEAELSTEVQRLEDIHKRNEQAEESRCLLEEKTKSLQSQEKAVQEVQMKCRDLEEKMDAVCEQVTQVRDAGELECHHAVKAECLKWEAREARLVAQLKAQTGSGQVELKEKATSTPKSSFTTGTLDSGSQTAIQTCEIGSS